MTSIPISAPAPGLDVRPEALSKARVIAVDRSKVVLDRAKAPLTARASLRGHSLHPVVELLEVGFRLRGEVGRREREEAGDDGLEVQAKQ